MNIDLKKLWDFGKPELSEERFRSALSTASHEDALILQTQIARTYGIRMDFSKAQQILHDIESQVQNADAEVKTYYYLELGRTYSSATHPPESQTDGMQEKARSAYMRAYEIAKEAKLDGLAIDALHMMTVVDTSPERQLEWNRKAMELVRSSSQEEAKKWAGSIHNNTGYALHLITRYDEALEEFKLALAENEKGGDPAKIRIAHWMIAWTLRSLSRFEEAIEIQLRLEKEWDEAGEPDPYVFEELELLYRAVNENEKADLYATRRKTASS